MPAPRDTKLAGVALDDRSGPIQPGVKRDRPHLTAQRQAVQEFFRSKPTLQPGFQSGRDGQIQELTADNVKAMNMAIQASNGTLAQSLAMQQAMSQQQSYLSQLAKYDGREKGKAGQDENLANAKGQSTGKVSLGQFSGSLPKFDWDKNLVQWKGTTLNGTAMAALQLASRILGQPIKGGGWRSHASQVALYQQKPDLAAPPGQSWHELGMAIDLTSKITPQLVKAMKKAGWVQFDAGKEPWHFSYKEPH